MWGPHVSTDSHVTLPSPSSPNCARKISGGDRRRPHQSRPLWPRSPSSYMPIKRPRRPLSVPPHPSPSHASRPTEFLAGAPPLPHRTSSLPVILVTLSLSFLIRSFPLSVAHLLMPRSPFVCSRSTAPSKLAGGSPQHLVAPSLLHLPRRRRPLLHNHHELP